MSVFWQPLEVDVQAQQVFLLVGALVEVKAQRQIFAQTEALLGAESPFGSFVAGRKAEMGHYGRNLPANSDIGERTDGQTTADPMAAVEGLAVLGHELGETKIDFALYPMALRGQPDAAVQAADATESTTISLDRIEAGIDLP